MPVNALDGHPSTPLPARTAPGRLDDRTRGPKPGPVSGERMTERYHPEGERLSTAAGKPGGQCQTLERRRFSTAPPPGLRFIGPPDHRTAIRATGPDVHTILRTVRTGASGHYIDRNPTLGRETGRRPVSATSDTGAPEPCTRASRSVGKAAKRRHRRTGVRKRHAPRTPFGETDRAIRIQAIGRTRRHNPRASAKAARGFR